MDLEFRPETIHPTLTNAKLSRIGQFVWDTAIETAQLANWKKGDDLQVIGSRRFKWFKAAISLAAIGPLRDFLSIEPKGFHLVLKVNGVPCRVFRGNTKKRAPKNYREATPAELSAQLEAFPSSEAAAPREFRVLRFILETDNKGLPLRVLFAVIAPDGSIKKQCEIAVSKASAVVLPLHKEKPAATIAPLSLDKVGKAKVKTDQRDTKGKGA